jgi:hypothetical protein
MAGVKSKMFTGYAAGKRRARAARAGATVTVVDAF